MLPLTLLAACVRTPSLPDTATDASLDAAWQAHRASVLELHDWTLRGRVGIRLEYQGENGPKKQGWSAGLHWVQNGEAYQLRVTAPLGQSAFSLDGTGSEVVMRVNNQQYSATDPEALMRDSLGWSIPVQGFGFWLKGVPQPDTPVESLKLDENGRMQQLEQDGWRIRVDRYSRPNAHPALPEKLILERDQLKVRVAVKRWQITPL